MDNKNNTVWRGSTTAGYAFTAVVLCYLVFSFIFSLVCSVAGISSSSQGYIYVSYLIAPAATSAALPLVFKKGRLSLRRAVPVKTKPIYFVIAALLSFGLLFSLSWLNTGFYKLLELCGYKGGSGVTMPSTSGWLVVPALFVIAVIPAISEETLFRGVMLGCMEEDCGTVNSVLMVGFCFALFHANPIQTIYQFACGCAFALLAVRSRAVLPAMIAHMLNNGIIIVLDACGLDTSGSVFDWAPLWAATLITVLSALVLIVCVAFLVFDKKPVRTRTADGVKNFFLAAAAGMAALAVVWIAGLF